MNYFKSFLLTLSLLGASGVACAQVIPQDNPETLVKELSETVVTEVDARREELEADPQKIKTFADEFVLPYVDTPKMARYVMGRYWRMATAKQQAAFVDAFTNTLLRSYSRSILKLKVTSIVVEKMIETREGRASIKTEVTQADGNKSTVVYRAYLNKKSQKWFLYDVSIEGISMLLNYRKSFASEFQKLGIDEVIESLVVKNNETKLAEPEES
ncbi:ABC transporter substrate-binding protein [Hydrogenovibrio sp. 3SP14C1]|uniref:MlaC/ttg2D family ABC transporter substrate-binding protein n=1 Tax=Hydrogenovibrio sp. 3SP14C1 TaxID=3038774 RepID=UPI00241629D0|nr:ABC transporter substrate-binding protein [Hydrogenovibrio sp. 3SP14C1]MDG4812440.1 ABC transporter substrate-binding protein [Hydrogenovibrio sp. 3SP14C1]